MTMAAMTMGIKAEAEYARATTSVWWDIENCEVPRGWDAHAIAQNVSSALLKMGYRGPVSISAYGDTNLIPHDVQQALSSTGVGLNHVPAGVKDASDKKILVDMCLCAVDNPAPANFMLISGDRDFSYALHQLRMRRYNILLAQPPHASAPLVAAAKNVWLWTSLASGGLPLTREESSRILNNGRSHVTHSEQAQSSKPTDSTPFAGDAKDHKTRETHSTGGLWQETRINMPSSCRGGTSEYFNGDKRYISQAAFVASQKVQANVSAKPIQAKVFQITCTNKETYAKHQNNFKQQLGKSETMSGLRVQSPKEVMEKQMKKKASDYACRLCNVACQNQIDFDSHLKGRKHAATLRQSEALTDSKKFQGKCIGLKYQPKEKSAKQQFQSQDAHKNSKCSEKHVVMVRLVSKVSLLEISKISNENAEKEKKETDSWKNQVKGEKEIEKTEEQGHEKVDELGLKRAQDNNEELKERCAISESSKRSFTVLKREPLLHKESMHHLNVIPERAESQKQTVFDSCLKNAMVKEDNNELKKGCTTSESIAFITESRGCLDIIPERVQVPPVASVIEKLEDKSKHKPEPKPLQPENESAGCKEHLGGDVAKKEKIKCQVDNFWTRLFGKKS